MNESASNILIAFFSRSGQNYVNGNIENLPVGNTEVVATMIAQETGGDLFKIDTVKDYPVDYYACTDEAQAELNAQARPELVEDIDSLDGYDTIILGYPNWWGTMPMAVYTFLEAHDFAGKVILPYCTHEGSGLSGTERDIARVCPDAQVGRGLAIHGAEAARSEKAVSRWLEKEL